MSELPGQSGHALPTQLRQICATSGLSRRSKQRRHSISSSARARIAGGSVIPSALAVFTLIASSNLVRKGGVEFLGAVDHDRIDRRSGGFASELDLFDK